MSEKSSISVTLTWQRGSFVYGWTVLTGRCVDVPCTPLSVWPGTPSHTGSRSLEPTALPHLQYTCKPAVIASNTTCFNKYSSL